MSTLRDELEDPWWRLMYDEHIFVDRSNAHRFMNHQRPLNMPVTTLANTHVSYGVHPFHNGVNMYSIGGVSREAIAAMPQISRCTAQTAAPHYCADKYAPQNYSYDRARYQRGDTAW